MKNSINPSRRALLRHMSALSVLGAGMPMALNLSSIGAAAAQTPPASDYKAIVCLFLAGGNDAHNTVLATDATSFNAYNTYRVTADAGSIALKAADVLPIVPATLQSGRTFALHPNLGGARDLFNLGRLGIVANVGPLLAPTTKAQFTAGSVPLPPSLMSHGDQSFQWQNTGGTAGWGNRLADLLVSTNGSPLLTCLSGSGSSSFLAGSRTLQVQFSGSGVLPFAATQGANLFGSSTAPAVARDLLSRSRSEPFAASQTAVVNRSLDVQSLLQRSMLPAGASGVAAPPAGAYIAGLLQNVARVIGGHATASVRRQVFYVAVGSFDHHTDLAAGHGEKMTQLGIALKYFDDAMGALNMRDNVTLFTASDFGRTLVSNGTGADHGWGGHHFVLGGAVKGGNIYGRYPIIGSNTSDDIGDGRLLPTTSVDQMGSTIGRWFGLNETQLDDVFPHLGNFASNRNLGFMKT